MLCLFYFPSQFDLLIRSADPAFLARAHNLLWFLGTASHEASTNRCERNRSIHVVRQLPV